MQFRIKLFFKITPLLLAGFFVSSYSVFGQVRNIPTPGGGPRVIALSEQEAQEHWQKFRKNIIRETVVLDFTLQNKGLIEKSKVSGEGRLSIFPTQPYPWYRIELTVDDGGQKSTQDFIFYSGVPARAWKVVDGVGQVLPDRWIYEPFYEGLAFTGFDLLMPFIHWEKQEYVGAERIKGRPAQVFDSMVPATLLDAFDFDRVRLFLDDSYHALLHAEVRNGNEVKRNFKVHSFKKVSERYIFKYFDVSNLDEGVRTRFQVRKVAFGEPLPTGAFNPLDVQPLPELSDELFEEL